MRHLSIFRVGASIKRVDVGHFLQKGKKHPMIYTTHYPSPLGDITLESDGISLVGLWFDGRRHAADMQDKGHEERPDLPVFIETRQWLDIYFNGDIPHFTPLLRMEGSTFRQRVWQQLLKIPYGSKVSYGDIARSIGCQSAQAVGGAVGHNPISLIVPCHRVVGADGSMTGYGGGIDRKIRLLELECKGLHHPIQHPSIESS